MEPDSHADRTPAPWAVPSRGPERTKTGWAETGKDEFYPQMHGMFTEDLKFEMDPCQGAGIDPDHRGEDIPGRGSSLNKGLEMREDVRLA